MTYYTSTHYAPPYGPQATPRRSRLVLVLTRGNRRTTIFHDDADSRAYLERLERYRHRDGVTLHAYVLMPNHVHLLLETGDRPLARMMQTLQFAYSQMLKAPSDCKEATGISTG